MKVTREVTDFAAKLGMSPIPEDQEPPLYRTAKLHDRGGSIDKVWMVEYYVFDHKAGRLKRKQLKVPKGLAARERRKWAKDKIADINRLLAMGYSLNAPKEKGKEMLEAKARLSVNEAFGYIHQLIAQELRKETVKTYGTCIRGFLQYAREKEIAELPVGKLSSSHTAAYLDSLTLRGLSGYTYNSHLTMLRRIAGRMQEREMIKHDFTEGIGRREVMESANIPFTDEQKELLEEWMKENSPELLLITRLIYYAFLRPSEITRLKVGDINLKDGVIRCRATMTKNKKTDYIPISKQLRRFLIDEKVYKHDPSWYIVGDGSRLVPSHKPTIRQRMTEAHSKAMKACGISGKGELTLYTWKDTGAVNAYKAGIDIKTLQGMLRHHSLSMTEIYLRSLGFMIGKNIEGKEW